MPRHGPGARGLRRDCHADAYMAAFEAETLSERWALMAIAEAKFLESGVATPMYTAGGCYAMSRVPFRAGGYASWLGDRVYFDQMVITNEIISTEDYEHIVEMWYELTGIGADFGDPETYLDGLLPYGDGFAIRKMGLW